jgi:hypothetical protein
MQDEMPHDFLGLCQAIGYVVVHWALIEQQLDNWVNVSFINCGGAPLRKQKDIPRSLNQKIKFLKICFRTLAALEPFRSDGTDLVNLISTLAPKRNNLIHGAITSIHPVNGAFEFRKIGYDKQTHTLASFEFTLAEFSTLEESLSNLLTESLAFSVKLGTAFLK